MKVNYAVSFCTHFVEDSFSDDSWRKRPKEIEDSSFIPVQKKHKEIKGIGSTYQLHMKQLLNINDEGMTKSIISSS